MPVLARWRAQQVAKLALTASLLTLPVGAARAETAPRVEATPEAQEQARQHFQKARDLYQAGSYREAIGELEAAHALDPAANELVFNLGVVNEKLGNIDEALRWFRAYVQMDVQPQERQKAESFIKRLAGAKREVRHEPPVVVTPPAAPAPPRPPPHGRIDVLTVSAAVLGLGGFAVGTVMGIKAVGDTPANTNGPFASREEHDRVESQADHAHGEARVADVGLAVGVAGTVATAFLYFARTKDPHPATGSAAVSLTPRPGGATLVVEGSF